MPDVFTSKKPSQPIQPPLQDPAPMTHNPITQTEGQPRDTQLSPASQAALVADKNLKHNPCGLFASYVPYPEKIFFTRKSPNEEVVLLIRRHWFTNLPWVLVGVIGAFLPILTLFITFPVSVLPFLTPTLIQVLIAIYYVFLFGYVLTEFVTWFYNLGVVTTERIIDIDYDNLTYKSIAAADLVDIEEVHAVQKGFFQTIFNYGDINIQTESTKSNIEFYLIPHPVQINDMILDMVDRVTRRDH